MFELQPEKFHALVPALRRVPINHLFARSVLEQEVQGSVWVDEPDDPSLIHVVHPYGMTLLFGDARQTSPAELRAHLLSPADKSTDRWLQAEPGLLPPFLDQLLDVEWTTPDQPPGGPRVQRYTRTNFRFVSARYAEKRRIVSPPEHSRMRPLHAQEFALPDVSVSPHKFWRNADQFLARGGGWGMEIDGRLASMAFCSFRFDDQLEIGVETRAEYRGRGYALHAACALIDECLAQDLEPVWSCRKENKASYRLAQALGFESSIETPYYRLPGC